MPLRRSFASLGLAVLFAACVPPPEASRDGGTPCATTDDCNPAGQRCGVIRLCVTRFCSDTTVVRACDDGAYPDAPAMTGNCFDYTDCNAPPACGSVVACVGSRCDTAGPRLEVPCADAGGAPDARADAGSPGDVAADATPGDGG